jgi:flavodoxin
VLFYFTGTGNSLYVAKQLEKFPVSIPQAIHDTDMHYEDETMGIVCPVYGHEMPQMVKEFLKKAEFVTDYFYLVLTYGHTHGGAAELAEKFLMQYQSGLYQYDSDGGQFPAWVRHGRRNSHKP